MKRIISILTIYILIPALCFAGASKQFDSMRKEIEDGQAVKLQLSETTAPATPPSGKGVTYIKSSDSLLYFKSDAGTEYDLTSGGSSGVTGIAATTGGTTTGATVTLTGAGIASTSRSVDTVTITATEVDGSITNELNLFTLPDANVTAGTAITFSQAGAITITESAADTILFTVTEVDGSTTNEINTVTADAGGSTTGLGITLAGGGITTTSRSGDTVTVTSTEADTLNSVVGRGATTTTAITAGAITSGANGADGQVNIFSEQGATDYSVVINPHATMTQTTTYTLPANDGDASQYLQSDGAGALSWATITGFDSTTVDATTWSDGLNASNAWTFNVSGTDHTMTAGSALMTFSNDVTATGLVTATGGLTVTEDIIITCDAADEEIVITQSNVAGTENVPFIAINDSRTGTTADEAIEATLVIDTVADYPALNIVDGRATFGGRVDFNAASYINADLSIANSKVLNFANGDTSHYFYGDDNGAQDAIIGLHFASTTDTTACLLFKDDLVTYTAIFTPDFNNFVAPTIAWTLGGGADANDYAGVLMGYRTQANVAVTTYFDFYAMTGAFDGGVNATTTELAPMFRFGDSGSATSGNSLGSGDVLFEDDIEVDGIAYLDGGIGNSVIINGTTPTITVGDAGAEDTKVVFDGNAQDYYMGLDDTDDVLKIGLGSTVGTTAHITSDAAGIVSFPLQSACHVSLAATQENIATGTPTKVLLDTELYDINNDFASNKFTAPVAGIYFVRAVISWVSTTTDKPYGVRIYKNGAISAYTAVSIGAADNQTLECSAVVQLAATDYVELYAWHGDGTSTPDCYGGASYETHMTVTKIA